MAEAHIPTPRLRIRMLAERDLNNFVAYRNDDDVARFQDWPMPYPKHDGRELIRSLVALDGPTPGQWVQLAIADRATDALVGDLAVHLDDGASLATIGCTLSPRYQGRGYAVEAAGTMIDWLFRHAPVHRATATIDPQNLASARVLESLGFEYVGTARSAAFVRDRWEDDARFSMTDAEREAWLERPTAPVEQIALTKVGAEQLDAVLGCRRPFHQRSIVASNARSLADVAYPSHDQAGEQLRLWARAIEADGAVAGLVVVARPTVANPYPMVSHLLIDYPQQRRGIGRSVMRQLVHRWRRKGYGRMRVAWVPAVPGNAGPFFESLGFVDTGATTAGGAVVAELKLK